LTSLLPPVGLTKKTPREILRGRIALGGMLTDSLGFWVTLRLDCRVGNRVCIGFLVWRVVGQESEEESARLFAKDEEDRV
jgi:hypothetical protein